MYYQTKLPNKVKLITVPLKGVKTITILVMVGTGSKYENRNNNGVSHFLEHMFFKGTQKRPDTMAISGELDSMGAEFNAFTDKECTGYWVKVDSAKKEEAVEIVSDMLMNSKFSQEEIDREKGVIIEEKNMYKNNPMMKIDDVFEECLYGDTPAGWNIVGTGKNIRNFKRKDFLNYFNSQYGAENTVICFCGNISPQESEKIAKKYFKDFQKAKPKNKEKVVEDQKKPNIKLDYKDVDQINLSLGVRAYPIDHPDEKVVKMISTILGGSMSSRLFIQLRERNGLAYYVRNSSVFYTDSGYLTTEAGVPKNKLDQSIKIILEEYQKIRDEEVGEEELQRNKDLIKGRTMIQLESSDRVATWYARQGIFRKDLSDWKEFIKSINKITVNDIKRVSEDIFINKGLNLALIGPHKKNEEFKGKLKLL
ncbi:insulinase family protein [bacterium]|nr:insulinase family protein [bacterium]